MEIWNYLGSQSAFSEVFAHFLAQSGSKSRAQVAAQGCQGIVRGSFLTSQHQKKHQNKCLKCPKQVGMDSQDIFGVVSCPSSCHDVEILLFF